MIGHPAVTAYCVPGRPGRVVLTTAVVRELDRDELEGVLAHERAHLSGRHHLLVSMAEVFSAALPFLPKARRAPTAVGYLVERLADETGVPAPRPARRHLCLAGSGLSWRHAG